MFCGVVDVLYSMGAVESTRYKLAHVKVLGVFCGAVGTVYSIAWVLLSPPSCSLLVWEVHGMFCGAVGIVYSIV